MAKNKVSEWSTTAANNTDIGGINIAEGCAPSGINNAIRELMAQVKDMQTGTDADNFVVGGNLSVTGTTTLTGTTAAPTPSTSDDSTKIATTAFVQAVKTSGFQDGTVSAPSIAFADDTDTGIYSPGANQLAVATNGVQRVVFDSANMNMASTTNLQKNSNAALTLKNITYLTTGTSATYTTPTGVRALKVTVIGGGGGGGGVDGVPTASTNAYSGGGGGAGYATAFITSAESSYTYTVGTGGTGGVAGNNNGSDGGDSTFRNAGSTIVITGGGGKGGSGDLGATSTGATSGIPGVGTIVGLGTPGGIVGSGTGKYANGYGRFINGTVYSLSGSGYCPIIGGGVDSASSATGTNATNYGEGGGNVYTATGSSSNYAGGNGYQGIIIVEEYY